MTKRRGFIALLNFPIDLLCSTGFKRRQSTGGGAKARPLQLDEPEFELPQYADDPVEFSVEDKYKNIPDSNEALPQAPIKPKPRPVQKVNSFFYFSVKNLKSQKPPPRKPPIKRQQVCYNDDDLFS